MVSPLTPLPTTIFVHGYVTSGGQKMSKSLGNVIDPNILIDKYGTDAVRYFLLRHGHATEDFDITDEQCHEWYTAHLTNGLGNLVARVMKLAEEYLPKPIAIPRGPYTLEVFEAIERFEFNVAMDEIWKEIQELDQRITVDEPFKVIKINPKKGQELIATLVIGLQGVAEMLAPFMPSTSEKILVAIQKNKKPENLFPRI